MPGSKAARPGASSPEARARMCNTGQRDTACEVAIRRVAHARGLRYRVDAPLPFDRRRRADLYFASERVAIFIDGCFWHGCPIHGTSPRANAAWWREKIAANKRRDLDTVERLVAEGWIALRIWEHEEPEAAVDRIERAVRGRRTTLTGHEPRSVRGRSRAGS